MKAVAFITAFAVLVVSPAAFAQSMGEKTGVNSALGASPPTATFVKEVATSDMTEIAAGKIAEQRGNADEKAFATRMIADHTKTSDELKALVKSHKIQAEVPAALDSSHQSKIDRLRDAKPENFSSEFDSMQVSAHKDAVSLFERYAKGGENPNLREWAGKTLPTLRHHLEMAQDLEKSKNR